MSTNPMSPAQSAAPPVSEMGTIPMENVNPTVVTAPERPVSTTREGALLVHIYPTGPEMGFRYALGEKPLTIGRGSDCDVRIQDNSVSRRHARVEPDEDGYYAVDLESTNGTFVNDAPIQRQRLEDGDYVSVGNCIYRFLAGGNVEAGYHEEIYRLTIIDALTDTFNKRYFLEALDREVRRSARYSRPLALIMFDIDHFKKINDDLGHLGGDCTLRELTARAKEGVRADDIFARYGGEEFGIVLPETTLEGAVAMAERIRSIIEAQPFQHEDKTYRVTVSMGVATTVGDLALTANDLIRQADTNLYQAKRTGRNRVVG